MSVGGISLLLLGASSSLSGCAVEAGTAEEGLQGDSSGEALRARTGAVVAACEPLTYQAEGLAATTGGATSDGWNIWSNGSISATHSFLNANSTLTVRARGSYAGWGWPSMRVTVGGRQVGNVTVSSGDYRNYRFEFPSSAGDQEIRVSFTNDYYRNGQDRNLYVDWLSVGCDIEATCSDGQQNGDETGMDCGGDCDACAPSMCTPSTLEAESMTATTGGSATGGWNIWSNGSLVGSHNFGSGPTPLQVVARGDSALGVWPNMEVLVGGALVGSVTVASSSYQTYDFAVSTSAGEQEVSVRFTNDYYRDGRDRNLYVDKLIFGCSEDSEEEAGCAEGTTCAGGVCNAAGECVQCLSASDCPAGGECQVAVCHAGVCATEIDAGASCSADGVCDSAGSCVGCLADADCGGADECHSAVCAAGSCALVPNVGASCQQGGVCDASGACIFCENDSDCDDGDVCNGSETCGSSGTCQSGAQLDCSDGVACTADSCDPTSGCMNTELPGGAACDGGTCTDGGACVDVSSCDGSATGAGVYVGNVTIGAADPSGDLAQLAGIWCVTGDLVMSGTSLSDLYGLSGVLAIAGTLDISDNDGLASLSGLEQLRAVGGLRLTGNDGLGSLYGIDGLVAGGSLELGGNRQLVSLAGLPPVDWSSSVTLAGNRALIDISALAGIQGGLDSLTIENESRIISISAFSGLTSIGSDLRLYNSDGIASLSGLEQLESVGGALVLELNDRLLDLSALASLSSVGSASISANSMLSQCDIDELVSRTGTTCTNCTGNLACP